MELAWKGSKGSSLERVYASSEENAIIKEQKFGLRLKVIHLKYVLKIRIGLRSIGHEMIQIEVPFLCYRYVIRNIFDIC